MKKILFLILVIALSGCVSRKTAVKENFKLDVLETVDKTEKETETVSKVDNVVKDVKVNVTDKTVTRTTETEYSAPDESGSQHKTKEKTTETRNDISVDSEESEKIISEQKQTIERQNNYISSLETRLSAALSEKTKTTTRAPFWTYIVAFVGGAVVAIFTRQWIKTKFNR